MHSPHFDALALDQQNLVNQTAVRLEHEFAGTFSRETVEQFIIDSLDQLAPGNKVPSFLSLMTERFARDRLKAVAKIEGLAPSDRPSVLFMCVHNAGRSQMAAGWLRHLAGDRITVYSGGSEPTDQINPAAVAAMADVGVDITSEFPKPWTDEIVRASDVVVTMGCGDACPLFPGKRYEDWQLDDPAGRDVDFVIPIRDDIRARVEQLMASLGVNAEQVGS